MYKIPGGGGPPPWDGGLMFVCLLVWNLELVWQGQSRVETLGTGLSLSNAIHAMQRHQFEPNRRTETKNAKYQNQ